MVKLSDNTNIDNSRSNIVPKFAKHVCACYRPSFTIRAACLRHKSTNSPTTPDQSSLLRLHTPPSLPTPY